MAGKTQLVTVDQEGNIHTIRTGLSKGLDLRDVSGTYSVRRVSEIEWEPAYQGFVVSLKTEPIPTRLSKPMIEAVGMSVSEICERFGCHYHGTAEHLSFQFYEEAVVIEVEYLTKAKEKGIETVW